MKEIPQILADAVSDSAKMDWLKAKLIIKVLGGSVDKFLEFDYVNGHKVSEFLTDKGKVSRPVYDLHKLMNTENPKHWNRLIFDIDSNGKFELNFEWDQSLQDEYEYNSRI